MGALMTGRHSSGAPRRTSEAACDDTPGQCPRCAPQMYAAKSAKHRAVFDSFETDGVKR